MIAMINKKTSEEDVLTGEFFGHLRYISFQKVMKEILMNCVFPKELRDTISQIDDTTWADKVHFWDRQKNRERTVELDVRIDLDKFILGIEVKYMSGLSSEDEEDDYVTPETSWNQLSKEARVLKRISQEENKQAILLLLAREQHIKEIYESSKDKVDKDVLSGFLSWEDVSRFLSQIKIRSVYDRIIIDDVNSLLEHYGLKRFDDFDIRNSKKISVNKIWNYEEL